MNEKKAFDQSLEQLDEFIDFIDADIENIRRVIQSVKEAGIEADFMVHAKSETVEESAKHTDVDEESIVKTLVFIADEPIAVLCPGDRRVSEEKLKELTGEDVRMANPDEVEEATGYIIGGVSPFDLEIPVYMDEKILENDEVKPAAGSRVVGITVDPEELKDLIEAEIADIAEM